DADTAVERLESSREGLSEQSAFERCERYGHNVLEEQEGVSALSLILKQLRSPLIYLLAGAAVVSVIPGHYADAAVIGAVIILNTLLGFVQEFRAEQALDSLRRMASPHARVLREGDVHTVDAADVVPGDILVLETGDRVAADARVVSSDDLEVDEALLTGESEPVLKHTQSVDADAALGDRKNMVWTSTSVTAGRGRAVVVATGMESQLGEIAGDVQSATSGETPLQKRMGRLGTILGVAGVGFAAAVFLIGILGGYELLEMALFAVAVAVSAIPEGLPAVISVTLALGVQRMARRNAIIRSLPAVETLGSTTVICSDKTGTITRNEMTVTKLFVGCRRWAVSGEGYSTEGSITADGHEPGVTEHEAVDRLLELGVFANNATFIKEGDEHRFEGSPTERAILACSAKGSRELGEIDGRHRIDEIPFSSATKYMATLVAAADGSRTVYLKGAPEKVLSFCSHALVEGERRELTSELRDEIRAANERMAGEALRVIAGAVRSDEDGRDTIEPDEVEHDLTFVGLWGMIDPPREDAVAAIRDAQAAGIRTIMITGDHAITAAAVAHQAGIAPKESRAITGPELDEMSDEQILHAARDVGVFARVSPSNKLQILNALRGDGEVVAMTGDGVNDAPALKGADIGIAMGITGTEVAKGASDMILLDDDYATIVHAVEEGRVIFNNLQRVIFFLLATNLGEILTLAAGLVLGLPLPLTAVMILWINLITDGACTIPLGVEPRQRDVLKEPPRDQSDPVLNRSLLARLGILSAVMAAGTVLLFIYKLEATTLDHARTIAFTILAAFQWFQAFNARSTRGSVLSVGILTNRWLLVGVGTAVVLQLLAIYTGLGQAVFGTVALRLVDWSLIVGVAATIWIVDEIRKMVVRRAASG
ncbi:MAG: cation-translocating P-type ATPase, partial [Spirochaetota bacterium]